MENLEKGLTNEERLQINLVGAELQKNATKEADASKSYVEQKIVIENEIRVVEDVTGNEMLLSYLKLLLERTNEKISDELNHSDSLLKEFVELTGIPVSEN